MTVATTRGLSAASTAVLALALLASPLPAQEEGDRESESRLEDVEARAEARRFRRLDADGRLPDDALVRAWERLKGEGRAPKTGGASPADAGIWNWEWLGPGNIGGRLRAIVFDPADPDIMVAGTAGGGLWRTTNGGAWWEPVSDFLPALPVVSLATDPTNTQTIYAGTGERVGSNASIPGAGIFRSTDGGVTWQRLASTAAAQYQYVGRLAHHPSASGTVLAATRTGVHRTTDWGASWNAILHVPEGASDVDYDPSDPQRIWVGTYLNVHLSTDGGAHWTVQTSGNPGKMPDSLGRCEIAFAASRPHIVYVSPGRDVPVLNDMQDTIWRSTNGGGDWNPWMPTNADRWSNAIWVSPTDSNLVVWGGFGDLFRTTNGGATPAQRISDWRWYDKGKSAHGDQHVIIHHPGYNGTSNRTVFVGNDGGVQKTLNVSAVDDTTGWINLANNLGVSQFFGGAISPAGTMALGGTQDNGVLLYTNTGGAQGWTLPTSVYGWTMTGDGQYAAFDHSFPARMFITYPQLDIWRSNNGGETFEPATNGLLDKGTSADWLAPFVIDPTNSSVLVAGGGRIWRTTNGADEWKQIRGFIAGNYRSTAVDIARTSSSAIWVGYGNGAVSHTTDAGLNWTDHAVPWGTVAVTDIAINPWDQDEVVVTVGGSSASTVWITTDAGLTWLNRNGAAPHDLPAVQVNTVRYHPLQPDWLYVGTDLGVFASEDRGLSWSVTPALTSGNEGPNNVEVDELFWQGTTYLVAATHGRGMYRCAPLPVVYVDHAYSGVEDGTEFRPFNTVEEAVNSYGPGALVSIKSGTYDGPALVLGKRGRLVSTGGTTVIR